MKFHCFYSFFALERVFLQNTIPHYETARVKNRAGTPALYSVKINLNVI